MGSGMNGGLGLFRHDQVIPHHQHIKSGEEKGVQGLLGRANDRLAFHVEGGVKQYRQTAPSFKLV